MLVLLTEGTYGVAIDMASCGRMDIPSFMKTGAGVQATDI
jgi:hypothetical protein